MKQQSLASRSGFEKYARKSRRELFLEEMEKVVPWSGLEALVRPHYVKAGKRRQPVGLSIMLRMYFVQQWFNLSDPGVEEALYESAALRRFVGVDLGVAPAPDETTVLRRSESQGDRCLRSPAAFLRHDALRGAYDLSGCSRRDNREGVERQRYRVS